MKTTVGQVNSGQKTETQCWLYSYDKYEHLATNCRL